MAEQQKYAILDTDFVSKANIIKTESHVLADEVLALVKLLHRPGSRIMGRHLFLQLQKQPVKCFHTIFSLQK